VSVESVRESGGPAAKAPGISSAACHDGRAVFGIGSGSYCFCVA